jgi:hypothetical protein
MTLLWRDDEYLRTSLCGALIVNPVESEVPSRAA